MVGTPRSLGCETCRKRKKMCGRERPGCLACSAAGWSCPGYAKRWTFVDAGTSIRALYKKKRFIFESPDAEDPGVLRIINPGREGVFKSFDAVELLHSGDRAFEVGLLWPLISDIDRSRISFCRFLGDDRCQLFLSVQALGDLSHHIPGRMGLNPGLDACVSCLCAIYEDVRSGEKTSYRSTKHYLQSLNAVQHCIGDPSLRRTSETICATILLQLCELALNRDNGNWNSLSRGSALLMRDLGPSYFATGFERAMLESQRAFLIMQDRNAGRTCFLAEPQWKELPELRQDQLGPGQEAVTIRSRLCAYLLELTEVFDGVIALASCEPVMAGKIATEKMTAQVSEFKARLEKWYEGELRPLCHAAALDEKTPPGSSKEGSSRVLSQNPPQGFLSAVLDSITNIAIAQLVKMLLVLRLASDSVFCTGADWPLQLDEYQRRRAASLAAYRLVESQSPIGKKPLAFGLRQLAASDAVLDAVLARHLPSFCKLEIMEEGFD